MKKSHNSTKKNKPAGQQLKFAKKLKLLASSCTADDKKTFVEKNCGSKATVSRYLNGQVSNLDYAAKLIGHLSAAHKQRTKLLNK